jgi:outer membrane protein assembly factor BamB
MNINRSSSRKEKPMNASTKTMSVVTLGVALAISAGAAEPAPRSYSWRGVDGTGVFPAKDLVTEFMDIAADYEPQELQNRRLPATAKPGMRKNIVWRTLLPHWGNNAPIAVGDKVFVLCNEGWKSDAPLLVCLDARNGKILWQKEVDHMDAWPQDQAAVGKQCRANELARWRKYMGWWNKLYWDDRRNAWKTGVLAPKGQAATSPLSDEQKQLLAQAQADGLNMAPTWGGSTSARHGLAEDTGEGAANFKKCVENRYYWYQGWTSDEPYYGSVMGSVVSDGRYVYAVTALSAAACFDMDGQRVWVTDLGAKPVQTGQNGNLDPVHFNISSPVLAEDKLLYYDRDGGRMLGLDKASGRIVYQTAAPVVPGSSPKKEPQRPGYEGYFAPGGTPVVMRIASGQPAGPLTTAVVSGHGLVVRVSDGALLGQVTMPRPGEADPGTPSSTYNSWTAKEDVLFCQRIHDWYYALRLQIENNALRQELKWRSTEIGYNPGANLILAGDRLIVGPVGKVAEGQVALDILTGKETARGPSPAGYSTGLGAGDGKIVFRAGVGSYSVVRLPDLKPIGGGVLVAPKPTGEVRQRHIAFLGKAQIGGGWTGITCFGNRIYARDTDYLWCIGDPEKPYLPPEAVK